MDDDILGDIVNAWPDPEVPGKYEKRWVDEIVNSGGVEEEEQSDAGLDKLVKQFEKLKKNNVLGYLDEKLKDSAWQKQVKAVTLIDALCKGHSSVIDYFSQSPENLKALTNAKKSIIRRKVNKVIEYLELSEEEEETEEEEEEKEVIIQPKKMKKVQPQPQNVDLLNIGGGAQQQEEEEDDMFANMNTVSDEEQGGTRNLMGGDMFANMNQTQEKKSTNATDDIMGIMTDHVTQDEPVKESKRKKENCAFLDMVANDTNVAQDNDAGDILCIMTAQPQENAAAASGSSAFGFDLGGDNAQTQTENVNAQASASAGGGGAGSSAFGFDLSGGAAQQTQQPQMQPQTQAQPKASTGGGSAFGFDLGGSGGGGGVSAATNNANRMCIFSFSYMSCMMIMNALKQVNLY